MDITDATPQRIEVAIDQFLEGNALSFHVYSYSERNIENTTSDMVKDKISRSKQVLNELMNKSPKFKEVAIRLPHQYIFCHDYGNGAVRLAEEIQGKYVWLR
jgi:hypothetical protein